MPGHRGSDHPRRGRAGAHTRPRLGLDLSPDVGLVPQRSVPQNGVLCGSLSRVGLRANASLAAGRRPNSLYQRAVPVRVARDRLQADGDGHAGASGAGTARGWRKGRKGGDKEEEEQEGGSRRRRRRGRNTREAVGVTGTLGPSSDHSGALQGGPWIVGRLSQGDLRAVRRRTGVHVDLFGPVGRKRDLTTREVLRYLFRRPSRGLLAGRR